MKAILIVEAFSTGMFYLQDILDRGFLPLVIYPRQSACGALSEEYERSRAACQKKLPPQAVLIPDDGDFSHLLQALSSYDILCVVAGSELGVTLADRLAEALEPCQEAECLAPDEMRENLPFAHTAIFLMQAQYSLEERVSLLFSLIRSVKPGGRILIPESIYGPMSIGRKGLERLLAAFGVILEIPLYQKSPCILGTVSDK